MSQTLVLARRVRTMARDEARRQAAEALAAEAEAESAVAVLRAEIGREAEAAAALAFAPDSALPGCRTFPAWHARMQDRLATAAIAAETARDGVARARAAMVEADRRLEQVEDLLRRNAAEAARAEAKRALEELNELVIFRSAVARKA